VGGQATELRTLTVTWTPARMSERATPLFMPKTKIIVCLVYDDLESFTPNLTHHVEN
jgi:hypothetical protein